MKRSLPVSSFRRFPSCVCLWYCVVVMLNERVNNYITISLGSKFNDIAEIACKKMKISECVRVQHWFYFSRWNKTKISISVCLYLLLFLLFRLCCHCWLVRNSFVNRRNRTPPMFYIFSRPDICMRSASNYPYILDMMVYYPPSVQNLSSLNPDEYI